MKMAERGGSAATSRGDSAAGTGTGMARQAGGVYGHGALKRGRASLQWPPHFQLTTRTKWAFNCGRAAGGGCVARTATATLETG